MKAYEIHMKTILDNQPYGGEDIDMSFYFGICKELEDHTPGIYYLDDILENDFGRWGKMYQMNVGKVFCSADDLFFLINEVEEQREECVDIIAEKLFCERQCIIPEADLHNAIKKIENIIRGIKTRKYTKGELSNKQKRADQRALSLYAYLKLYYSDMDENFKKRVCETYRRGDNKNLFFAISAIIFNNPLFYSWLKQFSAIVATRVINGEHEDCIPFILIADGKQRENGIQIKWTSNRGKNYYNDMLEIMSRPDYRYSKELQALLSCVWTHWDWNPASYKFTPQSRGKKSSYIIQELNNLHQEINEVKEKHELAVEQNRQEHQNMGADIKQAKEKPTNVTNNYYAPVGQSIGNANINNKQQDNGE